MILDYSDKTTTTNEKKNTYIYLDLGSVNWFIETQENFTSLIKGLKYTHIYVKFTIKCICMNNARVKQIYLELLKLLISVGFYVNPIKFITYFFLQISVFCITMLFLFSNFSCMIDEIVLTRLMYVP